MLSLLIATVLAAPVQLGHQGRVLAADGGPLHGPHDLQISLRDADDAVVYSENFTAVPIDGGFYSLILGSGERLDSELLNRPALYVAVSVDGALLGGRTLLVSAPYAARATTAGHIDIIASDGSDACSSSGRIAYDTTIGGCASA